MSVLRLIWIGIALILAVFAGLVALAARSDFVLRGCADMPRDTWEPTVNCADGWFGQWFFGVLSLICIAVVAMIAQRRRIPA